MHIGLIGAGNISETHARAASEVSGLTVAAVWSRSGDHARALAERHNAKAYETLEKFLEHRPMDLVAIGTPSGLHAEHGIACARRGLHVLVEKPIEISTARADALIDAARENGVKLGVFFQDRLKPDVERLKALVDGGRLGEPVLASARVKWYRPNEYYARSTWRGTWALDGGGSLINQGVHTIDLLVWLFGPVRRVFGRTAARVHGIETEDTAVAVLEFESGALGTIETATSVFPGYSRRLELTGSQGTLILEGDRLAAVDLRDAAAGTASGRAAFVDASAVSPQLTDTTPHRRIMEDFILSIERGTRPCCDGIDARASVALIEAIYASARTCAPTTPTSAGSTGSPDARELV